MGLIDRLFGYDEIKGPEFTKDFPVDEDLHVIKLLQLLELVTDESKVKVEKELLNLRSGLSGERNVYYELKNSRLPIVCLHDIRLEYKNLEAQFDFIVIASEFILVLETKRLFGNVTIDHEGNFTREYQIYNRSFKEGMYSPITQNERHVRLLEEFLIDQKLIKVCPIYSLIVIANDKTIVNKKYAKAEVKNLIIKHDQLIERLNQLARENDSVKLRHNYMREISQAILQEHKPIKFDFVSKLGLEMKPQIIETLSKTVQEPSVVVKDVEESDIESQTKLHSKLKKYRYKISKEKNVKAYYVFNNNELDLLVSIRPKSKDQYISIQGFGERSFEHYGEDIIGIIKESLSQIEEALKAYRTETAKNSNLKAYEVFNNQQLEQIIELLPSEKEQLAQVKYYSKVQIDRFGDRIIAIIKENF